MIHKQKRSLTHSGNQQIQRRISVHVRHHRPSTKQLRTSKPNLFRHIFKPPSAKISIERVIRVQSADVDIDLPVTIVITQSDPRTVQEHPITSRIELGEPISKTQPSLCRALQDEPNSIAFLKIEWTRLHPRFLRPETRSN